MAGAAETLRRRVAVTPVTVGLLVGDVVAIAVFVVLGEISHGVDPVREAAVAADTMAPFLVGWLLASVPAGVYAPAARRSLAAAVTRTTAAWVGAVVVGQALRSTSLFHGEFAPTFLLVSLGVGLALLLPWRVAATRLTRTGRD